MMRYLGIGLGAALVGAWAVALYCITDALAGAPGPARPLRLARDGQRHRWSAACYAHPVVAERAPGAGAHELWSLCPGRLGSADLVRVDLERATSRVWASGLRAERLHGFARHADGRVAVLAEQSIYLVPGPGRVLDLEHGDTGFRDIGLLVRGMAWDGDTLQVVWSGCHGCTSSAELARLHTGAWRPAPVIATYDGDGGGHTWRFAAVPVPAAEDPGERVALVATYRDSGAWRFVFLAYAPQDPARPARLLVGSEREPPVQTQTLRLRERPAFWAEHELFDGSGGGVFAPDRTLAGADPEHRLFIRAGDRWRPATTPELGQDMKVRYDYQRAGGGYRPIALVWPATTWKQQRDPLIGVGRGWFQSPRPGHVARLGSAPRRVANERFTPRMMFGAGQGGYWLVDPGAGQVVRVDRALGRVDPLSWWRRLAAQPLAWLLIAAGPLALLVAFLLQASPLPARSRSLLRRPQVEIGRTLARLWSGREPRARTRAAPGRPLVLGVAVLYALLLAYYWDAMWTSIALL